jgi:hypothetical protein
MLATIAGNGTCMTTHPAVVAILVAGVGLAMLLVVLAVVAMLSGAGVVGLELAVVALGVGGATRLVTERADRALVRA